MNCPGALARGVQTKNFLALAEKPLAASRVLAKAETVRHGDAAAIHIGPKPRNCFFADPG